MKKDEQGKLSAMQHLLASLQGGKMLHHLFSRYQIKNITNVGGMERKGKKEKPQLTKTKLFCY